MSKTAPRANNAAETPAAQRKSFCVVATPQYQLKNGSSEDLHRFQ